MANKDSGFDWALDWKHIEFSIGYNIETRIAWMRIYPLLVQYWFPLTDEGLRFVRKTEEDDSD